MRYTLHPPFSISARLLPALAIGDGESRGTISIDCDGTFWIDLADGYEHHVTDYQPGAGGRSVPEMFGDLLAFLSAAADCYDAWRRDPSEPLETLDGGNLFPVEVMKWASDLQDEIDLARCEIEESETARIETA